MKPYLQLTTLNIIADTLAKFHQTKYLFHFRKCAENEQNANTHFPLGTLARLDRVLRSAARLVWGLSKFSSITAYMRDVLHWLPISERIQYRITAMVSRCVL